MWLLDAYCFCRDEMAPNLLRQGMLKTHSDTWPATDCACATFGHVDVQETLPGHWQLFFFWSFHGRKTHFQDIVFNVVWQFKKTSCLTGQMVLSKHVLECKQTFKQPSQKQGMLANYAQHFHKLRNVLGVFGHFHDWLDSGMCG